MASHVHWSAAAKNSVEGATIRLGRISGSWTTLTIGGIPAGATLQDGSGHSAPAGNTSVNVTGWNLGTLQIITAGDTNFTLTATTEGGQTASEPVVVKPLAPTLVPVAESGVGGSPIPLNLGLTVNGPPGENSLASLVVGSIPVGAVLSDGTNTFTAASGSRQVDVHGWNLSSLTITPAGGASFSLNVTATERDADGDISAVTRASEAVAVTPATAAVVGPVAVTGVEGAAIGLNLGVTVSGQPGGATNLKSLVVSAIPVGAVLSDGTHSFTAALGSQQVDVHTWNLASLTLTPVNDGHISLGVAATPIGSGSATRGTEAVTVNPLAPTVLPVPATGAAGTPIPLNLGVALNGHTGDTNSLATLVVSGIPVGATLTDGSHSFTATSAAGGQQVDIHTWTLANLKITSTVATSFSLGVTAAERDLRGDLSAPTSTTEAVTVTGVTPPTVLVVPVAESGIEGAAIGLNLGVTVNGVAGSASNLASLLVSAIPVGAVLTDGTAPNTFTAAAGSQQVDVRTWNLASLTIKPANDTDFALGVAATPTGGTTATSGSEAVKVTPLAPLVVPVAASGAQNTPIPLTLGVTVSHLGTETNSLATLLVSGIPVGATLTDGTAPNTFTATSGSQQVDVHTWNLAALKITPTAAGNFSLNVTATEQDAEGNPSAPTTATEAVTVTPAAVVAVVPVAESGIEGAAIGLNLGVTVNGVAGSASNLASLLVSAIPVGAVLTDGTAPNTFTAAAGSQQVDVRAWNLASLTIKPANDTDFALGVAATPTGGTTATSGSEAVKVTPLAPLVVPVAASGAQNTPIPLTLGVTVSHLGTETNSLATLLVSGIPVGATLTDGTAPNTFTATSGSQQVDVHTWNLAALKITPTAAGNFSLNVTATEQDAEGNPSAPTTATEAVTVTPAAVVAVVPVAESGIEGAAIGLNLGVTVNGQPGNATNLASLLVSAIPVGAVLTDGTAPNTFTAAAGSQQVDVRTWNLASLTIKPANDTDFALGVAATPTGGTTATSGSEAVKVTPLAPLVVPVAASGAQNTPIPLTLGVTVSHLGTETNSLATLLVSGIPVGATLTDGTAPNTFTATSGSQQVDVHTWNLAALKITPTAAGNFSLNVTATEQDAEGNPSAPTTATEAVTVTPAAVVAVVPVAESGIEGAAIGLNLGVTVNGVAGSASNLASLLVSAIPVGAVLTDGTAPNTFTAAAGSQQVDVRTWNLASLTIKPANDTDFALGVAATPTGGTTATSGSEAVKVTPLAPLVVPVAASGAQNTPIPLTLGVTVSHLGTETNSLATLLVSGIPVGATLTDGTAPNTFTATSGSQQVDVHTWNLAALKITPTAAGNFSLNVTATEQDAEGNPSAPTTATEAVTVTPAAGRIISTAVAGPVALAAGDNPLSITGTGSVTSSAAGADGVDGPTGTLWTITNGGTVSSSSASGILLASGGSVSNAAGASIAGGSTGIDVTNGLATVTNAGSISGTGHYGVTLDGGGNVTNTGSISGFEDAVRIQALSGTVTNSGTLTGSFDDGIGLFAGGSVTNAASGLISSTGATGASIFITGGAGTVTNNGRILDTTHSGIRLSGGGSISNAALASIVAFANGIDTIGGPATVTNAGTVNATGPNATGIYIESTGAVTNTSTGSVTSGKFGVFLEGGFSTLANYGSIAAALDGVVAGRGGAITNAAGASITAVSTGIYIKFRDPGTVTNAGSVSGTGAGSAGVSLADGGKVTNVSGGSISGVNFGVFAPQLYAGYPPSATVVTNAGTISSTKYGAVSLQAGGSVTNNLGGLISGASNGVYINAGGAVTNSGSIRASNAASAGVSIGGGGSLTNTASGSISGDGFGVFFTGAPGTVSNAGTVTGSHGVALEAGGSLTNTAKIIGGVAGVFTQLGTATVSNTGAISASTAGGSGADIEGGGSITNNAGGSISGTTFGVFVTGGSGIVTNASAISGGAYAVDFAGSGTNRLVVDPGATFTGGVTGTSSATNILELAGGSGSITGLAGGAGTVTANGSSWSFKNFNTLDVDPGGSWTVNGADTIANVLNDGTIAVAGSLGVPTAIDSGSDGVFQLDSGASIDIASILGSSTQMQFLGSSTALVDDFTKFGLNVGTSSYAGPQLQDFGTGDTIDLKNFASATDPPSFNSATGLLTISNGSAQMASLDFQTSSLGSGTFHAKSDGASGTLITLS